MRKERSSRYGNENTASQAVCSTLNPIGADKEEGTPCPNSVYGYTKLAGEQEALKQCPNTMVIRTAWLYSTFGNNFVKTMIRLGQEKETLGVIFDQIGTPT